jgi:hypothetical protein
MTLNREGWTAPSVARKSTFEVDPKEVRTLPPDQSSVAA